MDARSHSFLHVQLKASNFLVEDFPEKTRLKQRSQKAHSQVQSHVTGK